MNWAPRLPFRVSRWAVWSLDHRLLASVVVVELLAFVLLCGVVSTTPLDAVRVVFVDAAVLLAAGIAHTEIALRIERVRRRVATAGHVNLVSVWTFAATVLFPAVVACALVLVIYAYTYVRVWRPAKVPAYRQLFSTATIVLAVMAAAAALGYFGASGTITERVDNVVPLAIAALAFTAVNTCLVVGVVVMSSERSVGQVLGDGDDVLLEIATLCLGAIVAAGYALSGPVVLLFALPPLLVLHRAVLVKQLERAANTDTKTGLLSPAAWQRLAAAKLKDLGRVGGSGGLLVLDLDRFKRVNDSYGHLAGDIVLAGVGRALAAETREQDIVGRFGGEEFVILLPRTDGGEYQYAELASVAERVRQRIRMLEFEIPTPDGPLTLGNQSVSIGGAVFPRDGAEVDALLTVADSALYAAKRAGRNRVRFGPHRSPHPPARPGLAREATNGGPA